MEEDSRVEGKTLITSKQRGSYQSRCSSYFKVFYKLFQTPQGAIVILRIWCENFGRDNEDSKIRFIGLNGTLCVGQKLTTSRDFMIWRNSVMHYWEKSMEMILYFIDFSKIFFFLTLPSWKPTTSNSDLFLGKALFMLGI